MAGKTIVLAHGVLGFGDLLGPFGFINFINYFNGIKLHLERQGHTVFAPSVNPIGSVAQRGDQLAAFILGAPDKNDVHILAHSMGGLDARHAITNVAGVSDRVASLVTIGTPHQGSPVADALANPADPLLGPLSAHIPMIVADQLRNNLGALHDLRTDVCKHFDAATTDVARVRYIEGTGDASGARQLFLFQLTNAILQLKGDVNDGLVTKTSALRIGHTHLPDWPVDHAGEIGWFPPAIGSVPFVPPQSHFARYDAIVNML
jgi:triacylglycerol lipase